MTVAPIITCRSCDEDKPHAGKGLCADCYHRNYLRLHAGPAQKTALAERIEQEIARGTPTRRIMDLLSVDYGVVKAVRDEIEAANAS